MKRTTTRREAELPTFDLSKLKERVSKQFDWQPRNVSEVIQEYRRFLALCKVNPESKICPSKPVDEVWHLHILDTTGYERDCMKYFGYFMHHEPCLNGNESMDKENTARLYQEMFGASLGQPVSTCANPGNGCGSIQVTMPSA